MPRAHTKFIGPLAALTMPQIANQNFKPQKDSLFVRRAEALGLRVMTLAGSAAAA